MPNLATLKRFAALDPDSDDEVIQLCMDAAIAWLDSAGVPNGTKGREYDLAVYRLATHYYDNRGQTEADKDNVPPTVISIMHQLRSNPQIGVSAP